MPRTVASAEGFSRRLHEAPALELPLLIALPIDYTPDVSAIAEELGAETAPA